MNSSTSTLSIAENRSWSYWFADGLPQLLIGISAVLFGFYFISTGTPSSSKAFAALSVVAFGMYQFIQLRATQILACLKARITYPRTGSAASPYFAKQSKDSDAANLNWTPVHDQEGPAIAEIKRARQARNRRLSLTYLLHAGTSLGLWFFHAGWISAVTGMVMGVALWIGTRADKSLSLLVVLGFPLGGLYLGTLQLAPHARVGYFILGAGLLFLPAGLLCLLLYLLRNAVASHWNDAGPASTG